jgi:hypothetical protein
MGATEPLKPYPRECNPIVLRYCELAGSCQFPDSADYNS